MNAEAIETVVTIQEGLDRADRCPFEAVFTN